MKYTRKQLIKAQMLWNDDLINNPEDYEHKVDKVGRKYAKKQIDHLISLIK
jgi:hypothetical protein